jgi:hypothetical protein
MDSRIKTNEHIAEVQKYLMKIIMGLQRRLLTHDHTKLESPEVEVFDIVTDKLHGLTYDSKEYNEILFGDLEPALQHHYQVNRHHPQHYKRGIIDMNLVDLCEMIVDWKAATLRHADGNIRKSLEINQSRFGYTDELKQILINTVELLESE